MIFVLDFDGTIAPIDTVDALLENFGSDAWHSVEQDWVEGKISSRVCMSRQIDMVAADRSTLDAFFDAVEIDPGFVDFVRYVSPFAQLAVVSDGLDYPIQLAMQRMGIPKMPVYANKMTFRPNGLGISFPHALKACATGSGVCKCAVARSLDAETIVLVGDGRSDFCLAKAADYVFAKGSLIRFCEQKGVSHTPFANFCDVLAVVREWDKTTMIARGEKRYAT